MKLIFQKINMFHFKIVPANEFTDILRIQNTNIKGKDKVMFVLTALKGIGKKNETLILKNDQRLFFMNKRKTYLEIQTEIPALRKILSLS